MPIVSQTTQQQLTNPVPALPITGETATGVGAGTLIVGLAIMWLRRRISRDGLETAKDRAEGGMVDALMKVNKSLIEENERLMKSANEAWSVRNADAARIATLETELGYLRREFERLRPIVVTSSKALSDSGLMPLQDMRKAPRNE